MLRALADQFVQREYDPGEVIAEAGQPADHVLLLAHGKVEQVSAGKYGEETVAPAVADGDYFGGSVLAGAAGEWEFTARAVTAGTVLALPRRRTRKSLTSPRL